MMRKNSYVLLLLFWAFLCFPFYGLSLPTDKNQPATISSNTADYNQNSGKAVFYGKVVITQGSTEIKAIKLTTYTDKHQKLLKAIAVGSKQTPAIYQTIPKKGKALFTASANLIEYFPQVGQVRLIGHAKLQQGQNSLSSNYILYDTKTGQLQTKRRGKQRTVIVITPNILKKSS